MAKPIINKSFGPNFFWLKIFPDSKRFQIENFLKPNFLLTQNFYDQKFFFRLNFLFLPKKILGFKNMLTPNIFEPQIF